MSKKSGKVVNMALATVAMEGYIKNASLDVTQELPDVTALSDLGGRVVIGNYRVAASLDGDADFAGGASDATIFAMVATTAVKPLAFDPTGAAAAAADDPHYDLTDVCLASYSIRTAVGGSVTYAASLVGNSSMARSVA